MPALASKTSSVTFAQTFKNSLKNILTAAAGLGAVATIVFFPPATIFISPAVTFLAGAFSFAGIYAGMAAFVTVLTGAALATAGIARLTLEGVSALYNKFSATESMSNVGYSENSDSEESNTIPASTTPARGPSVHRSPIQQTPSQRIARSESPTIIPLS